jgi:hypothetical protein
VRKAGPLYSCVTLYPMVVRNEKVVQERSIAAEIEAVQRSANYGIFGLLRHKFRLSSRERQHQSQQVRPHTSPRYVDRWIVHGKPTYRKPEAICCSPSPTSLFPVLYIQTTEETTVSHTLQVFKHIFKCRYTVNRVRGENLS